MSHYDDQPMNAERLLSRRGFLGEMGTGLGCIALACLLAENATAPALADAAPNSPFPLREGGGGVRSPLAPRPPHFPAKAKRVLQIFCPGAVSQMDTFEHKPELQKRHGQPMPGLTGVSSFQGGNGALMGSPWEWKQRGQSGKWISDLFPHLGECADEMCFIHSLTANSNTHGPAMLQMNTGFVLEGFPSMGAWVTYALGTENQDLPAFVAIPDTRGLAPNGPANWSAGFLPAAYQGTAFNATAPIANLNPPKGATASGEKQVRDLLGKLNKTYQERHPAETDLAARIAAYELAARMQLSAPAATDLSRETAAIRTLYGADSPNPLKASYAQNCILARRLLEKGVRFVQLYCGASASAVDGLLNWDAHKTLKADYERHCPILDQPTAALLQDLKQRGLLDDTLVLWTTEFGRMPTRQIGAEGRDHNPYGFTAWMAGAGVKPGFSYGATDEFGYKAEQNPCTIYDFHATVLRILGLDHKRLTFYHNGSNRRLTDVHGEVLTPVLA